jgi:UDP-N-acetylglucosamine--N-acetylmuramyl-(pentapeptide) pyrophosphoryl-undecaprenol N-acetylglucosamine transferase
MIRKVLVAGGGTGGHLFPGLAVVEELRRRVPDLQVMFVGSKRGLEAKVLPERGERFVALEIQPLLGRSPLQLLKNASGLPRSTWQAASIVREFQPDVAIGLGGYAAGPALVAATALGVKTALLEQNVHVGLTNRLLARTVGRAYLSHERTLPMFGPVRGRVVGNPVRRAFVEAARMAGHDPQGTEARARTVLVLGGSQGARSLNTSVPDALHRAGVTQLGVRVVHQTGAAMADEVRARYRELGVDAEVAPFIDDMARAYIESSLVVSRAGFSIIAELCVVGRPSILVPLPTAAEGHQAKNAHALEADGAAVAMEEPLDAERLGREVRALLTDLARRQRMSDAARRLGRPDAAAAIVDDLFGWLGVPSTGQPDPGSDGDGHGPESDRSAPGTQAAPSIVPAQRRTKVKRAPLRLREVDAGLDAAG